MLENLNEYQSKCKFLQINQQYKILKAPQSPGSRTAFSHAKDARAPAHIPRERPVAARRRPFRLRVHRVREEP